MVVVQEFRIPMPFTIEEYRIANLYTTAKTSRIETEKSGGAGVEVLKNEPCTHPKYGPGQYTLKKYYIHDKLPGWMRPLCPKASAVLVEESYNCYPYVRTEITMAIFKKLKMTIETQHKDGQPGADDNALQLNAKKLKARQVEVIDIAESKVQKDSAANYGDGDPTIYRSSKSGRGPLKKGWSKGYGGAKMPVMCCYKLVTADFDYFGLKSKVENFLISYERDLFSSTHRQMFCWMDEWFGLSIDQIRLVEEKNFNAAARRSRASLNDEEKVGSEAAENQGQIREANGGRGGGAGDDVAAAAGGGAAFDDGDDSLESESDEGEEELGVPKGRQAPGYVPRAQGAGGGGGSQDPFLPRRKYGGSIKGYVFKLGDEGLGYYKDTYSEWMNQKGTSGTSGAGAGLFKPSSGRDTINIDEHLGIYGQDAGNSFDDDISTDSDDEQKTSAQQAPGPAAPPRQAKKGGGGIMDKLAGLAVNQIVKHSKPELWDEGANGKGGVPQRGGGGVADESEETDDSDTDGDGVGAGGRKAAAAAAKKKKDKENKRVAFKGEGKRRGRDVQEEDEDDEEDDDDDDDDVDGSDSDDSDGMGKNEKKGRKGGKPKRMCAPNTGSLFGGGGMKELWLAALCLPPNEGNPSARGVHGRGGKDVGGAQVPGWGETLTSLSWTKYQFKLKSEGAKVGQTFQRASFGAVNGLVEGGKAAGDWVGRTMTGTSKDSSYPLYKGDSD